MKNLMLIALLLFSANSFSVERPDLEIEVKGYIFCDGARTSNSDKYSAFCTKNPAVIDNLYIFLSPSMNIIAGNVLQNVYKGAAGIKQWCTYEIYDGRHNPGCVLRLRKKKDGSVIDLSVRFFEKNIIQVEPSLLSPGETYSAKLIESNSGSNASSQSFLLKIPKK